MTTTTAPPGWECQPEETADPEDVSGHDDVGALLEIEVAVIDRSKDPLCGQEEPIERGGDGHRVGDVPLSLERDACRVGDDGGDRVSRGIEGANPLGRVSLTSSAAGGDERWLLDAHQPFDGRLARA